ncbi:MAG: acyl-CoA dehydrogenase [Pseudonocardiales bacterium]|nr:acyl-CoA dehydrogenase [Pseudonocardiales bacterium]
MDRWELRRQDYSLDSDQEDVREAFSEFFAKESPSSVVRAAEPLGYDAALWEKLVGMGVTTMSLPAALGGDDATLVELVLVAEELGRNASPVPLISHVVSVRLLAAVGADRAVLDAAAAGLPPVALALAPLTGTSPALVPDAAIANDVIALSGEELVLFRSAEPAPFIANHGSTPLGRWDPAAASGRIVLASGPAAVSAFERALGDWKLLTAAALIGLTQIALDTAVEFAKTRETMGVPIGSLQGVAFPLADVAIGVTGARNLIWRAAWMSEYEPQARPELIAMAYANAARVATRGTTTSAHMQGGLGFTIEADASLYFLRAKGWSVLAGDPNLDLVGIGAGLVVAAG